MDNEIWRDIKGYEGYYQVSNWGRIKSLKRYKQNKSRKVLLDEKILYGYTRRPNTHDYLNVVLCKNGTQKRYAIHRLVALAFLPNPENKKQVNHLDGNKQNNKLSNLEWCTNKENCRHAVLNDLHKKHKRIVQCDIQGNKIKTWELFSDVEDELGIDKKLIHRCCYHKENTRKAKGFIWKFEEEYLNEQNNNIR